MDSRKRNHYRRNKLYDYRYEKIDINLIKNYKNYNIKSRNGRRYKTVIKYSTKKIKYFLYCRKIKTKYEDYNTVDGYIYYEQHKDELNGLDRDINREKFKMSIHYMKKKLPDELIYEISTFL